MGMFYGHNKLISTTFNDWFLPSSLELNQMYLNLRDYSVGGMQTGSYWSSTEYSTTPTYYAMISSSGYDYKANNNYVRPARVFTIVESSYSLNLRDRGPSNGYIFFRSTTGTISTYYEAAPTDISGIPDWSNITGEAVTGTSSSIGSGAANTDLIVAQAGHVDSAAKKCLDFVVIT